MRPPSPSPGLLPVSRAASSTQQPRPASPIILVSTPTIRVAPAIATLLVLLVCLQVLMNPGPKPDLVRQATDSAAQQQQQVVAVGGIGGAPGGIEGAGDVGKVDPSKDSRRLYARKPGSAAQRAQQASRIEQDHAEDPFDPDLSTQLKSWYSWLTHSGQQPDGGNMQQDPAAHPLAPLPRSIGGSGGIGERSSIVVSVEEGPEEEQEGQPEGRHGAAAGEGLTDEQDRRRVRTRRRLYVRTVEPAGEDTGLMVS